MNGIGVFAGALVIVFLLSRLALALMRSWRSGGVARLVVAHLVSFLVATVLGGIGFADGGAFAGAKAAALYAPFQVFWLVVDVIRLWVRSRRSPAPRDQAGAARPG